jgi:hypothetical protein
VRELRLSIAERDGRLVPTQVPVRRVLLAGYTGRDRAQVAAHIHELEELGVTPPERIPMVWDVAPTLLTTTSRIGVSGAETSGEAEFCVVAHGGELLIGVGSDHTDRRLEAIDLAASKAACPKVLSAQVWRYADLRPQWDELLLRAWVGEGAERRLYQEGTLASFLSLEAELEELQRWGYATFDESVLFGGTLSAIGGLAYAAHFEAELADPRLHRSLRCGYEIVQGA